MAQQQESTSKAASPPPSDERFRHMLEISLWTNALHDPDELLSQVVELLAKKFGYSFVAAWLLTEHDEQLAIRAASGEAGYTMCQKHMRVKVNESRLIGQVAHTGIHAQQLFPDAPSKPPPDHCLMATRAELAVPLRAGDAVAGVLDIQRDTVQAFSQEEVMMLQTLAGQIALALRVAELHRLDRRRRYLDRRIQEAGQVLSGHMTAQEAPNHILEQLRALVPYERGALMLQVGNEMHAVAAQGFPDQVRALQMHVPLREGDIFEHIARTNQPLIMDDVTRSLSWSQQDWLEVNHSWMGVPLIVLDKAIGMLSLTRRERGAFSNDDATAAMSFAAQAAILLESARLYDRMASINDELERKAQERTEELAKAYKTLERLDQTKADFIGIAAHELRTPLTVISGYANMLSANPGVALDPAAAPLLEGIVTGTNRMLQIINNMLDVTRIDTDVLDLDKAPTRLSVLFERLAREFQDTLDERKLSLDLVELHRLPVIRVDPNLMYKVFYHLIVNAIKYTPNGGRITVHGDLIKTLEMGDVVQIEIADSGIGIAPEDQQLIFEKFYQTGKLSLHSSGVTKFAGGGPGLGLAIAKGIVVAHEGKIWVESLGCDETNCPGSRFFVRLPLMRRGTGPLISPV
ncbi:MAG: GAF domain-containing protein [Thermoflexales bacterium]|nr:GAF domain-containing protein [Thermoflexales bacterium]